MLNRLTAMSRYLIFSVIVALLAACSVRHPAPSGPASTGVTVSGKVSALRQPVAGIRISAYPADSVSLADVPPYRSAPTEGDGGFELSLPAGDYYLLAEGEGFFGYYGRNPVPVSGGSVSGLNLALVESPDVLPSGPAFVDMGVMGKVLHQGRPLAGATVHVYTDLTTGLKGLGYAMAGPTDENGFFEAALPAGTYYLLVRMRQGAGGVGPLRPGDFVGYHSANPVTIGEGEVARVTVPVIEVPDKVADNGAGFFGNTSVSGRILDAEGRPVAGARAVLYDDPQMFNRPLFVSQPTGPDGEYLLTFPRGGTYYLAARDTLGGAPGPGDLYGTWDGVPDHSLQIASGEAREGIDIVVEEMW